MASIWRERFHTLGEELANSISHGVGFVGTLVLTPILIVVASRNDGAAAVVAASVFGATMILMYLISTLYHAMPAGAAKRVFNVLDHCAIYVLIAGSYTPFTLVVLGGGWGWSLFGIIWGLAMAGIVLKAIPGVKHRLLSTTIYVAMGWLIIVAINPLWHRLPLEGIVWLVSGGVAYTLGVVFYSATGLRYHHLIWHVFVLAGTTCHFIAILKYAT